MRQPELRENENTTVIMSKADEIKRCILIVVSAVVVISAICASIYLISKRFGKGVLKFWRSHNGQHYKQLSGG